MTLTSPTEGTSESAFQKALDHENAGNKELAEKFLKLAVARDKRERNLPD